MTTFIYILTVLSVCMGVGLLAAFLALGVMGDDDEQLH